MGGEPDTEIIDAERLSGADAPPGDFCPTWAVPVLINHRAESTFWVSRNEKRLGRQSGHWCAIN